MQPAPLLFDLLRQVRELLSVELSLAQAELRERGESIPSSLTAVVVGLILLPIGAVLLFVAVSLLLTRLGLPLDLSFLIVAVVVACRRLVDAPLGRKAPEAVATRAGQKHVANFVAVGGVLKMNAQTSSDYEAKANRLRGQIGATIQDLRFSLTPSNLASEAAARAGIADLSWGGTLQFASKRHPVPTAIIGLGIALWTVAALRRRKIDGVADSYAAVARNVSIPCRKRNKSAPRPR